MKTACNLQALLDKILTYFIGGSYKQDVLLAQKDFFNEMMPVNDHVYQFDTKMSQFLDWYLLDYRLQKTGFTPLEEILETKSIQDQLQINDKEVLILQSLCSHCHSLFELTHPTRQEGFSVKDIFNRKKLIAENHTLTFHLRKGECFEARIVSFDQSYQMLGGICVHPLEARSFILDEVKKVRGEYEQKELMKKLTKMCFKHHQFPHIPIKHVYTYTKIN